MLICRQDQSMKVKRALNRENIGNDFREGGIDRAVRASYWFRREGEDDKENYSRKARLQVGT